MEGMRTTGFANGDPEDRGSRLKSIPLSRGLRGRLDGKTMATAKFLMKLSSMVFRSPCASLIQNSSLIGHGTKLPSLLVAEPTTTQSF